MVDINVGCQCEALVVCKLLAPVPGKRLIHFTRQIMGLFDECRHNALRIFVGSLGQHHITRMALYKCRNVTDFYLQGPSAYRLELDPMRRWPARKLFNEAVEYHKDK